MDKKKKTRHTFARGLVAIALVVVGTVAVVASTSGQSDAAMPYGGCKEAYSAPHSAAADGCRDRGWTIHVKDNGHGIVVSPHAVVRYLWMPACRWEDGSEQQPCRWNVGPGVQGNGRGLAYWIDREDRPHYVWRDEAHPHMRGVSRSMAESMAESGFDHTRWERWRYDVRQYALWVEGGTRLTLHSPNGRTRTFR